ncbi:MAG: response regulator transcription factor [Tannerella sp.]|jgi:DNA-binding NarL/FixJ family response regulator|nr:response regulator transcription factor [Tannerella sp.]
MDNFILADNQEITREGLVSLLKKNKPGAVIAFASSREELQRELKLNPASVVVLDYTLFDFSSVDQMLNMIAWAEMSAWILFSDELNEAFLRKALYSDDTISVVMKNNKLESIEKALIYASDYERFLCETAESVLKNKTPLQFVQEDNLTATEKVILREIALGKMTKEIAYEKSLSFHTVNTHRRNIFRKLGVNNVHEAIKYAFRAGLIDMMEYYI